MELINDLCHPEFISGSNELNEEMLKQVQHDKNYFAFKHMRPSYKLLALTLVVVCGLYLYHNVLPYHFSSQAPVTNASLSFNPGGVYNRAEEKGIWHGTPVISYEIPLPEKLIAQVLGENDESNKHIEVDLSSQRVYAYEGDNRVFEFVVSTGKWSLTPTGEFTIGYKTRATKMSGGNVALGTYYYLPNVPYVQFFGNSAIPWSRGYSFHGTYWHNNFGHPMSHGCINMRTEDAEKLFYWTTNGTPVNIYGTTPVE